VLVSGGDASRVDRGSAACYRAAAATARTLLDGSLGDGERRTVHGDDDAGKRDYWTDDAYITPPR